MDRKGHDQTALALSSCKHAEYTLLFCSCVSPFPLAAATQFPLTPPPDMASTTPPQAVTSERTLLSLLKLAVN